MQVLELAGLVELDILVPAARKRKLQGLQRATGDVECPDLRVGRGPSSKSASRISRQRVFSKLGIEMVGLVASLGICPHVMFMS